jgi:hypothetical protein
MEKLAARKEERETKNGNEKGLIRKERGMKQSIKERIVNKINDGDEQEMQKFADAYINGDMFWDSKYAYGALVLGKSITQYVNAVSKDMGLVGKVLASRTVKPGEVVRYDKDAHTVAYTLDEYRDVKSVGSTRYVYPPQFEVSFSLKFPDSVSSGKRFVQGLQQAALEKVVTIQNSLLLKLLAHVTKKNHRIVNSNFTDLLFCLVEEIEMRRIPVDSILLNSETHRKYEPILVDKSRDKSHIIDEDLIPEDVVYMLAPSAYLGGAPVHVELLAEPLNEKGKTFKGLFFYKLMSMVIINPFGVVRGSLG